MEHSALFMQYPTNRNSAESLQENAITIFGPRLYNSLPKYPRDIEIVRTEKFKFELDKFLELIPDEPKMPNYVTASGSNSILDQLTHLRAQRICQSGGVPDALSKLFTREGGAGADDAILPYVGHFQLISTLKIGADCCQLCQYKLTKPNQT